MYFSTTGGEIIEYDGTHWRAIRLPGKTTIRAVAADGSGRVYYGGRGKFGYLAVNGEGTTSCLPLEGKTGLELGSLDDIAKIIPTTHGVYFISTRETFRWHDNQITVLPVGSKTAVNIGEDIYLYSESSKGMAVIQGGQLSYIPDSILDEETYGRVRLLLSFVTGEELLFFSPKRGLLIFSVKRPMAAVATGNATRIRELPTQANDYFIQNKVYQAIWLENGRTAFVTGDAIVIVSSDFEITRIINDNHGLLTSTVYFIYQDRFKNLWAGLAGGIAYIHLSAPVSMFGKKSEVKSLVTATTRHDGSIYAGTFEKGPLKLPDYTLTAKNEPHRLISPEGRSASYAWSFLSVNNTLLVSSETVRKIDGDRISNIAGTPLAFTLSRSRRFEGRIYLGIAAPSGGGVGILEYSNVNDGSKPLERDTVFAYKGKVKGVDEVIRGIAEENNGNLWCSTQQAGLIRLRPKSAEPLDFEVERYNEGHGLPSMNWNHLYIEGERIWVATQNGVYEFVPSQVDSEKANRFVPVPAINDILKSGEVTNIVGYGKNRWLLNPLDQNGILSRNSDNTYTIENRPFRAVDVNPYVIPHIDKDGVVWTGMTTELVRYDPSTMKDYEIPYATAIRRIEIKSGKVVFGGTHYDPASKNGDYYERFSNFQPAAQIPVLEYEENGLTFDYSALFYEHTDRTTYSYRLIGFDTDWSDWSDKTLKEYTNIPEGSYTFQVKAKNIYGTESSVAAYKFKILAPWYRTIWAYVGYGLGFLSMMFAGMRFNSRRLLAAKRRLEKIVDERTLEVVKQRDELAVQKAQIEEAQKRIVKLEKEATEMQMSGGFAHEIRNALVGAKLTLNQVIDSETQGPNLLQANNRSLLELFNKLKQKLDPAHLPDVASDIKAINTREKKIDELVGKAQSSVERSLSVTEQILNYSNIGKEQPGKAPVDIVELLGEIRDEHEDDFQRLGIALQVRSPESVSINGERRHFHGVFKNVILNAKDALVIRDNRSQLPKQIDVIIEAGADGIAVAVSDNGVGIPEDKLERIFDPFFSTNPQTGTGLGLCVVQKYVNLYGGSLEIKSTVGEGTTVLIHFKA